MRSSAIRVAVVLMAVWTLPGCFHSPMIKAPRGQRLPPTDQALVWFIRGPATTDVGLSGDLAISDGDGHFVALLGRMERVGLVIAPGKHVYFAFRGSGSKVKAFHKEAALPPPAIVIEAAAGEVYGVETNLVRGEFATVALLSPRFGRDQSYLNGSLQITEPYAVDADTAREFDQRHGSEYWWDHEWHRGVEALRAYDAAGLESHTLHSSDGFLVGMLEKGATQ